MDFIVALVALLVLSPVFLGLAIAIRISCGAPILFRQWRTGWYGREFQLLKFRTMELSNATGPLLTRKDDPRVTHIGRWLRRWKLDELPQLFNVLRGDMSLVGPRPDLDSFWSQAPATARQALALKPGVTGAASIVFRNEESVLAEVAPEQVGRFYVQELLPLKVQLDLDYAAHASMNSDCAILLQTLAAALGLGSSPRLERKVNDQFSSQ